MSVHDRRWTCCDAGIENLRTALALERELRSKERAARAGRAGHDPIEDEEVDEDAQARGHTELPDDGDEILEEIDPELLAAVLTGPRGEKVRAELAYLFEHEKAAAEEAESLGKLRKWPGDRDPFDLRETGWGLIYARDGRLAADVDHLLEPLIELRREHVGTRRFQAELEYVTGHSVTQFLDYNDMNATPGVIDPDNPDELPYYLLIVGGPEEIPFELQYRLSLDRAVGRVAFDDPAHYRDWATRVAAAEEYGSDRRRKMAVFSAENDDKASRALADYLVDPLLAKLGGEFQGWTIESWRGRDGRASKEDLGRLLAGDGDRPGLVLVSSHGKRMRPSNRYQRLLQGAVACRKQAGQRRGDHLFHAGAVGDADLSGLTVFLTACYGAGTPRNDNYPYEPGDESEGDGEPGLREIAPEPFISCLAQTLLARGALAVVGHIDRGWTLSYKWTADARRGHPPEATGSLIDSLKMLLAGHRLGHALRSLYERHSVIAGRVTDLIDRRQHQGEEVDPNRLSTYWTALHDARNFVILGDPASPLLGDLSRRPSFQFGAEPAEPRPAFGGSTLRTPFPEDVVHLRDDVRRWLEAKAERQGVEVDRWLDDLLRSLARSDGWPLDEPRG